MKLQNPPRVHSLDIKQDKTYLNRFNEISNICGLAYDTMVKLFEISIRFVAGTKQNFSVTMQQDHFFFTRQQRNKLNQYHLILLYFNV